MTFKECRKYGREQLNQENRSYGYMYKDKHGDYTFSMIYYNTSSPEYVLEKNGVVDMILSILVYTFFSRMFDLMLPSVVKHSTVVV